jgi:hypothetical protein
VTAEEVTMNDANSVWDFMLLILWCFLLVCWIMILFSVIGDLFRDRETSGFTKFLWCLFLIVLPFLGVFVYVIVRGRGMAERNVKAQQAAKADFDSYVQQVAGGGADPATQIANAKALLDSGAIDQAEFDKLKAKALV